MSREEVTAVLRNLQLSLDGLQREVEGAIRVLPETRRDDLPQALAAVRRRLVCFERDALAELDGFAAEAGMELPQEPSSSGTDTTAAAAPAPAAALSPAAGAGRAQGTPGPAYGGVQLKSLERRVASMGGIPALGACVLPKMTPGQRPPLAATASPAAVEIMRGRIGSESDVHTPLRKVGGDDSSAAAAAPLVQLRATPAPQLRASADGASPGGAAPANSELAAAIARRMHRLSSASSSPDKEAAAAAAAEVGKLACEG